MVGACGAPDGRNRHVSVIAANSKTAQDRSVPKRVVFVVYQDLQILDLTGPFEVFALANRLTSGRRPQDVRGEGPTVGQNGRRGQQGPDRPPGPEDRRGPDSHQLPNSQELPDSPPGPEDRHSPHYELAVVSVDGQPVRSSGGIDIAPDSSIDGSAGPIDTLVVVGGTGTLEAVRDERLVAWIATAARRSRRVTSVCSGAFLLARAGLLDGRRATTHWDSCALLAESFPSVTVDPDSIFVRDGNVWTSAGVTTGMDLALALVEEDLGPDLARLVARWLVLFVQRPGGQAQFSAQLAAQRPQRSSLRDLEGWIADHLGDDLSVTIMAEQVGMSTRTFARVFRQEMGVTPAAYVEGVRVEAARRLLETTPCGLAEVARMCGFGTVETMHRVFKRTVRVTPGEYRRHFSLVDVGGAVVGPEAPAVAGPAPKPAPLPDQPRFRSHSTA
jgi:transcriptional regulator GlxA family with amidase domain